VASHREHLREPRPSRRMTENKTYNGVSTFLVRDASINGYTRMTPKQIARKVRLQEWKALLTFWSLAAVYGLHLFASQQIV
jgi:hypothetical protein